ncbi:hypothetical protein O9G_003165 [Rozella allomycis CSF55]|uniref:Uncharacterized protein n=1 Tax=Rozella allomycis (strain CSF55) TaxID=988480 RepID=A0A075AVE3_ROZAC|nr:hypothetical protein O9G_003165 [Rozella allomycis CSF55]|eukprot:EPZ34085.1 hypothetical protein O9G_003165 [Rozella allomycis CSF55]
MTPSQKQLDRLYADKIIPKTMYDVLTEELNEKQHYRRSQLNWERFAYYFCIPMAFVGGLSAYYEMSHRIEHSKEHYRNYKPYHFLRNRVKPFMFGDGDTTLFCNKEFEYIPGYVPEWYQKELEAAERGEAPEKEHH